MFVFGKEKVLSWTNLKLIVFLIFFQIRKSVIHTRAFLAFIKPLLVLLTIYIVFLFGTNLSFKENREGYLQSRYLHFLKWRYEISMSLAILT